MNNVDRFFQESYYNIIRFLLSASGLWPYQSVGTRCAIYFGFLLILGSGLTFEVLGMAEVWPDSFEVVDCLPLLVLGAVSIIKLICVARTLPEIEILLTKMRNYQYSPKSDEETNILHSYALYGRNLGYAYTGVLLSHTVLFVLSTLLSKFLGVRSAGEDPPGVEHDPQLGLPYRVNYMIDPEAHYVPIFVHTVTCVVSYTILMITFDVLYLTLVQHCCGLFAALRYRLERAFVSSESDAASLPTSARDEARANLVYSIRRHIEAIQFATIMESVHRLPLFVHVGANISVLSILGFQVVTSAEDFNRVLKHVSYLNALLFNTFFVNWQGQKIIDCSEKMYESAYNAEWYKMPIAQRKLLMMILIKSKRPLKMTAGNFVVLSYVNFGAVLRAASSYFMLLRSMQ